MGTKWGRQPAKFAVFNAGFTARAVAQELGVKYQHFVKALNGEVTPNPVIREELPKLLNLPVEALFTPEVLARKFWYKPVSK